MKSTTNGSGSNQNKPSKVFDWDKFADFQCDVTYQMELIGEMTTSDAQGIIGPYTDLVEQRFAKLENLTENEAKKLAAEILDKASVD